MGDTEVLSQLIKEAALVPVQKDQYGNFFVKLDEPQVSDSSTEIRNPPPDSLVIKVDTFRAPVDIFNGDRGECKRADYVIISEERKCILYIEIKKTKDSWQKIVKQLMGAECFVKYCQEIGKVFWNENDFLSDYKQRFISIGHTSIAKKKTRIIKDFSNHDSPERAMKIDWPNYLQFNRLAGKT